MTIKVTMTKDASGELRLADPAKAAQLIYAEGKQGRDIHLQIARPLHNALSQEFQREVRKVRLQREGMSYQEAADFVMAQRPELAYAISCDILSPGARALDVEADVEEDAA